MSKLFNRLTSMISAFRKLRQKLIPKTSLGKYLTYATGEVILVVIGILIALSINNWNEERQQDKKVKGMLRILQDDIANDLNDIADVLEYYRSNKDNFINLMNGTMTEEEFQACGDCPYLVTGHRSFSIETRGYEVLKRFNSSHDEDTLVNRAVQFYTSSINNIDANDDLISNSIEADLVKMRDKYDWFPDFVQSTDLTAYSQYATSSQEFRNLTAWRYALIYSNYIGNVEAFEKNLQEISRNISLRLSD